MKGYVYFDIETFNILNENTQDISCVAIKSSDDRMHIIYNYNGEKLSKSQAAFALKYLYENMLSGYSVVSWNGLSFDIPLLAQISGEYKLAIELAKGHYDVMFQVLCLQGYGVSLGSVAKAMKIPGKLGGLKSNEVPALWESGQIDKVLAYVIQDLNLTASIVDAIVQRGEIIWISSKGAEKSLILKQLNNVSECLLLPKPNIEWMDSKGREQWNRNKFYSWFDRYL